MIGREIDIFNDPLKADREINRRR